MFEEPAAMLQAYQATIEDGPISSRELLSEVQRRLKQMDYLMEKVRRAERILAKFHEKQVAVMQERRRLLDADGLDWTSHAYPLEQPNGAELAVTDASMFEAQLYTECFYYIAGRVRTILRNRTAFPDLCRFEAAGVRDVRNKLLEHAGGRAKISHLQNHVAAQNCDRDVTDRPSSAMADCHG